jgi:hypothetical protein
VDRRGKAGIGARGMCLTWGVSLLCYGILRRCTRPRPVTSGRLLPPGHGVYHGHYSVHTVNAVIASQTEAVFKGALIPSGIVLLHWSWSPLLFFCKSRRIPMAKVMLTCLVDENTITRLNEAARQTGRTRSQVVRLVLERVELSGQPDLVLASTEIAKDE